MQQDIVLLADFLNTLPVAFRWGDDTAARGHRLKAKRANRIRAFAQDDFLDLVCGPNAVILFGCAVLLVLAVFHAVRNADEAGGKRTILRVALVLTTCGHRRQCRAVVVTITVEDLVLLAAIALMCDLTDDLKAFFVGLRAGVRIIDTAHARHLGNQLFRKQSTGDRPCCTTKEIHLNKLVAHSIRNALAAIANIYCPNTARHRIGVLFAVLVPDFDAFAFDDHLRLASLETFMLNQMVPYVRTICVYDFRIVVVFECTVHLQSPSLLVCATLFERMKTPLSRKGFDTSSSYGNTRV